MKFILPAEFTRYGSRADGSFGLSFSTGELNQEQILGINELKNHYGFLMFKDSEIEKAENEIFDSLEADLNDPTKTPSKRLRSVLFLNWQQDNEGFKDFKTYYGDRMEKLITKLKDRLD